MGTSASAYFKKDFSVIVNFVDTEYIQNIQNITRMDINMNIHEMDEIR